METYKFFRKIKQENFQDLQLGKESVDKIPNAQSIKENMGNLGLITT